MAYPVTYQYQNTAYNRGKHTDRCRIPIIRNCTGVKCLRIDISLQYIRYADDFIIGMIGNKADAEALKADLAIFLKEKLGLTLSAEKTKITHSAELVRFLGYDLTVSRSQDYSRDKNGNLKRHWNGQVKLYLPHEKWFNKLLEYRAMYIKKCPDGKEIWKPTYRGKLINMPDAQIVSKFNSEIRGLYNYYRLAANVSALNSFYRIMRGSLFKTFGCKYRTTYKHIKAKYVREGRRQGTPILPRWISAECKSGPGFFRHYAKLPKIHQGAQSAPPNEKWHL